MGGVIGGICGLLGLMQPSAVGGGFNLIPIAAAGNFSVGLLLFIFIARVVTTLICFSSGAPGDLRADAGAGHLAGHGVRHGGYSAVSGLPSRCRHLRHRRDGGAAGRLGARARSPGLCWCWR